MIELNITIKGDDSTFKQKFLVYDTITMTPDDPIIQNCINEALSAAKIENPSITIRVRMELQ